MSNQNQKTTPPPKPPETPPAPPAAEAPKYPARAFVRTTTGGEMVHLFTGDRIGGDGKRIDIDHFAIGQIEAGKWVIFDPNQD